MTLALGARAFQVVKENEPDIGRVWMEEENNAVVDPIDKKYDAVEGGSRSASGCEAIL